MKQQFKNVENAGANLFSLFIIAYKKRREESLFSALLFLLSIPFGFFISFLAMYFGF